MTGEQVGRQHMRNSAEAGIKKGRESKQCGDDVEIRGKNSEDQECNAESAPDHNTLSGIANGPATFYEVAGRRATCKIPQIGRYEWHPHGNQAAPQIESFSD